MDIYQAVERLNNQRSKTFLSVKLGSHMPPTYLSATAAGIACDTAPTYENIRRRQQRLSQAFTAGMPAKLT